MKQLLFMVIILFALLLPLKSEATPGCFSFAYSAHRESICISVDEILNMTTDSQIELATAITLIQFIRGRKSTDSETRDIQNMVEKLLTRPTIRKRYPLSD